MTMLTQNRKGNGKQIVGTAQRFGRVDKTIRELCTHVIECRRGYLGALRNCVNMTWMIMNNSCMKLML